MAVFPNNSADYPGVPVSEEAPMLEYSLDEKHPPRDLTPEEKTFLNALAGFIMPLEQSLFFQIKDLQRHTKLVLSHSGGRFDSYESLKREELEKEFTELSKMMNNFQYKLWCCQLSEENEDLFGVWHELWELLRDKLEKMSDQPVKPTRAAPMGGYYNRGRDSKVEIFVDTIEESAHNDPYQTMLLMGQVLLHEYFHSFHFHVGTGGEEPLKCMEETMAEYGTLVLLDRVASSGLSIAKDAGAALQDLLARAQRNQNRSQHATAYALGAYLYENHKEEASNLIAQYANVSCLLDDGCEEEAECENLRLIYFERKGLKSVKWGENILDGVDQSQCVIIVPKGTEEEYKAHPAFKGFEIVEESPHGM